MMKRAEAIDLQSFMQGKILSKKSFDLNKCIIDGLATGSLIAMLDMDHAFAEDAIPAISNASGSFSGDTSWADYLIPMIQDQGLPLAVLMGVWACLEMIIRRPASAIDRLKWAVLGYLALQFVPTFIRHIGQIHHGE